MKLVLTIIAEDGDKTFRAFPFNPHVEGSREAAEERLQLAILNRPPRSGIIWEVKTGRELVTAQ